jgi:hypothetical protein
MEDKADWHKRVLLTEFDRKTRIPGHVRSAGAAHDCDSEEDRALQEIFLQLLAHCDIGVTDLSTKHVQRAE